MIYHVEVAPKDSVGGWVNVEKKLDQFDFRVVVVGEVA